MRNEINQRFIHFLYKNHHEEWVPTPFPADAIKWLKDLLEYLFPNTFLPNISLYEGLLKKNQIDIENILLSYLNHKNFEIEKTVDDFYASLEQIYINLRNDAEATVNSDPAATSIHEVIVSYPGFFATAVYRIAHKLANLGVPILPRILCEYAHANTGIDIHPNAVIGVPFVIDHGTGVVIGETSIIGNNVTIYQGVTLGALHVEKGLSDTKRHPTVGDNVIIYARTTILGGNTVIGDNYIIGGSVFLTKSIEANSNVFNTHQLRISSKDRKVQDYDLTIQAS
ncbi:MAG: serine acetyltransferase [Cytophagales bacterium]|nr:serine acetyltransferase [Cytophagales bacterium]